jgi:hypothetical protein
MAGAAARMSATKASASGLLGLTSAAKRAAARGTSSCNSPTRLVPSSPLMELTPVTLPPGRLRLATRPVCTGSPPPLKTIGMVVVADFAAAARCLPGCDTQAGRTRSANRYRDDHCLPIGIERVALLGLAHSFTNAVGDVFSSRELREENPTTGIALPCARVPSGHNAGPPTSNWAKLRRFTAFPCSRPTDSTRSWRGDRCAGGFLSAICRWGHSRHLSRRPFGGTSLGRSRELTLVPRAY